jgi:Ca2+-binding RTX toxin-like protein
VTVTPVNDAPVAAPDTAVTPLNTPITLDIVANDSDPDGDPLTIVGTPTSADGTVTVGPDGRTVTFTPNAGFVGTTVIAYTVTDPTGATASSTLTVTIPTDPLNGIVTGTPGGDLIDVTYAGDPEGDRIDNGDAIVPGVNPDADVVFGLDGDDTIISGRGPDEVYGGIGNDVIDTRAPVSDSPLPDLGYPGLFPADADPENDRDAVFGGDGDDTITTGDDADTIFGDGGNDSIDGGIDNDLIFGGIGDDTIVGGEGADFIFGEEGDDLIFAGLDPSLPDELNIPDATDLVPTNGTDTVFGGSGNDTIFGADDADELYGDEGDDQLFGEIDNDRLFGGLGADTLDGGEGEDLLVGGEGNDSLTGGTGADLLLGEDDRDTFTGIDAGDVIDGGAGGDDFDTLDLRGSAPLGGSLNVRFAEGNPESGIVTFRDATGAVVGTARFEEIENVVPCFTPGTVIATPRGERLVEELQVGDKIITRDNGIQEIRWIGAKALGAADLDRAPHLRPILIKRGSLGDNLPERDMMVSPNHRLLVSNERTSLYFDEREVLAAAKHMTGNAGVSEAQVKGTTYIHFMFDQHEVVLSNGCWSESFQPGDHSLKGIGNAQRNEILELFPELAKAEGLAAYHAARRSLKRHEAMLLVR